MRRYIGFAFILVAILTFIVWIVSLFVQPLLPEDINSGVVLFFVALLSVVGFLAAFKDTIELMQVFSDNRVPIANNLPSSVKTVSKDSLLLYPYDNPPYNSVELHYVGKEQAKDLQVWKIFTDKDGKEKRVLINRFFPKNDLKMIWYSVSANVMREDDIVRFHLVGRDNALDSKATVEVRFTGAQSGKVVKVNKEFDLVR